MECYVELENNSSYTSIGCGNVQGFMSSVFFLRNPIVSSEFSFIYQTYSFMIKKYWNLQTHCYINVFFCLCYYHFSNVFWHSVLSCIHINFCHSFLENWLFYHWKIVWFTCGKFHYSEVCCSQITATLFSMLYLHSFNLHTFILKIGHLVNNIYLDLVFWSTLTFSVI